MMFHYTTIHKSVSPRLMFFSLWFYTSSNIHHYTLKSNLLFSSAQWNNRNYNYRVGRNTNLNYNGLNHRSNNGRHNTNLNYRQFRYNYRTNQWNTNFNHNFGSR